MDWTRLVELVAFGLLCTSAGAMLGWVAHGTKVR